jgi:hypothetical protein
VQSQVVDREHELIGKLASGDASDVDRSVPLAVELGYGLVEAVLV